MVVCSPWNMSYSGGVSRVLTKQRNGGSEVQGAGEVVVVGQRRQNSSVDVAGSTQGANCNFESTGVLEMSHRGLSQRGLPAKDLWRGFKVDFVQQEIWARYPLGQG
uniref:Uncharacterized protein n=1 Tax=Oryza rufipogon TaxID=4529 RepID=A0A0E0NX60_ORYRU